MENYLTKSQIVWILSELEDSDKYTKEELNNADSLHSIINDDLGEPCLLKDVKSVLGIEDNIFESDYEKRYENA